jgi:transposase
MSAAAAQSPVIPTPRRTHVAHAWMTAFPYAELQAEADRRRQHPDRLAATILEKVLCRGLVDELLDH